MNIFKKIHCILFHKHKRFEYKEKWYCKECDKNIHAIAKIMQERKEALQYLSRRFEELFLYGNTYVENPIGKANLGISSLNVIYEKPKAVSRTHQWIEENDKGRE